jgi:PIN domain nuclease of toxin-antitoxin system
MYLLDTSVVISSALNAKRLGPKARRVIKDSDQIFVSSVSIVEIFVKQLLGKIEIQAPITELISTFRFRPLGFEMSMAHELSQLTGLAGFDPFDRMIAATAGATGATLITSDRALLDLGFDWIVDSYQ